MAHILKIALRLQVRRLFGGGHHAGGELRLRCRLLDVVLMVLTHLGDDVVLFSL